MLKGKYGAHIKFLAMPLEHVSSHEIRKLIESGEPVSEYIPAEVEAYIKKGRTVWIRKSKKSVKN